MICDQLHALLGFDCYPISEDGNIAMIQTPLTFDDGDGVPVFVQYTNGQVRFFDDGQVILHFVGRGLGFDSKRKSRFIRTAAEPHGVTLTESGELEVWAALEQASPAFAKYLSTLVAITTWERDQRGVSTDVSLFVEEVAMGLRAWKPSAELFEEPEYEGVSGHVYKLDFRFDGAGVLATSAHPNAINSAVKKLLDIRTAPGNQDLKLLAVIDDRIDPDGAKQESLIIQSVSNAMLFTDLQKHAVGAGGMH
jgi:hypothetical protein